MFTNDEWREALGQPNLKDVEVEEFVTALRAFLGQILDHYFREEFELDVQ
jgi:hypothetical protein